MEIFAWIIGICVLLMIPGILMVKHDENKEKEFKETNNVPKNAFHIIGLEIEDCKGYLSSHMWKENNDIIFLFSEPMMSTKLKVKKIKISIDIIKFFALEGDYRIKTVIEGGGLNLKGAIIGGVVAGGVGAILGGREKITTKEVEEDKRKLNLYYIEGDKLKCASFYKDDFTKLSSLIPEKNIDMIDKNIIKKETIINNDVKNNPCTQIKELSKLKDKGIITEEEFNNKKKILLERI